MSANSSRFASHFAPYAPPPDDSTPQEPTSPTSASKTPTRTWLPVQTRSYDAGVNTSYQSGGMPTFGTSVNPGEIAAAAEPDIEVFSNQWETTHGMRVDMLAACAYLLGPISAFLVLVLETQNDYVRFHAYQSALLSTPVILFRIFMGLAGFPQWLRVFVSLILLFSLLFMAFQAYRHARTSRFTRYQLPYIGVRAEQWVAEE